MNWNAERLKRQARENLNSDKGKELRKRRGNEVESVFGDQKLNKLKRRYHLRGLPKVKLEAGLYYFAHNVRRIHKISQMKRTDQNQNKEERVITLIGQTNTIYGSLAF